MAMSDRIPLSRRLPITHYPKPSYEGAMFKGVGYGIMDALGAKREREAAMAKRGQELADLASERAFEREGEAAERKHRLEELKIMYPGERWERTPPAGARPKEDAYWRTQAVKNVNDRLEGMPIDTPAPTDEEYWKMVADEATFLMTGKQPEGGAGAPTPEKREEMGFFEKLRRAPIRGLREEAAAKAPPVQPSIRSRLGFDPRGGAAQPGLQGILGGPQPVQAAASPASQALDAVADPMLAEQIMEARARGTKTDEEIYEYLVTRGLIGERPLPQLPEVRSIPGLPPLKR